MLDVTRFLLALNRDACHEAGPFSKYRRHAQGVIDRVRRPGEHPGPVHK